MIRTQLTTYLHPHTLEEAAGMLRQGGKAAHLIGGGIDLALYLPPDLTTLIDLSSLPLSAIEENDDGITIGAMARLTEVLEHPAIAAYLHGVVVSTLRQVASPPLRNLATIGGTLASRHPWSDLIPLFLALDAKASLIEANLIEASLIGTGEMGDSIPLSELYTTRKRISQTIITALHLPFPVEGTAAATHKFSRTGFDVALLNCACLVRVDGERIAKVRIVVGGTPKLGVRLPVAEATLTDARFTAETIEQGAKAAENSADVRADQRASAEYRRRLVYVGVKQCLLQIRRQLKGEGR